MKNVVAKKFTNTWGSQEMSTTPEENWLVNRTIFTIMYHSLTQGLEGYERSYACWSLEQKAKNLMRSSRVQTEKSCNKSIRNFIQQQAISSNCLGSIHISNLRGNLTSQMRASTGPLIQFVSTIFLIVFCKQSSWFPIMIKHLS